MSDASILQKVGSILLATNRPVDAARVATALEVPVDQVLAALTELATAFRALGGEVQTTPAGYRLATSPENAEVLRTFYAVPKRPKLSDEALETLYVIMDEGPVSLARISELRRVHNVRGTVETLIDEGLVEIAGRERRQGSPHLYAATQAAADRGFARS